MPEIQLTRDPGNRFNKAYELGELSQDLIIRDAVSDDDRGDLYRLILPETANLQLSLTRLKADADIELLDSQKQLIAHSASSGKTTETIDQLLAGGNYYVRVKHYSGDTTYRLNLSTEPIPNYSLDYGYGLVDAASAVEQALGIDPLSDAPDLGGHNWGLDMIRAPEVWQQGYAGQGVVVAVLDTGVDYTHADLNDNIWTNPGEIAGNRIDDDGNGYVDDIQGWNFVHGNNNPMDDQYHGTHVAGIIAAENNGFGTTGVAYEAEIMPIKVLNSNGFGFSPSIAAGIRYAVDNGADVINLSLGSPFPSWEKREAIRYAAEQGVVVVMSSGNDGAETPGYPALYAEDWGIAVGAVDHTRDMADFSNQAGSLLDYVVAPGVNILSTTPGQQFFPLTGTSMAAPFVSGVAALIRNANPNLMGSQIEDLLTGTANPFGITV